MSAYRTGAVGAESGVEPGASVFRDGSLMVFRWSLYLVVTSARLRLHGAGFVIGAVAEDILRERSAEGTGSALKAACGC